MVVLKNKISYCYFKYLSSIPIYQRNTPNYKCQLNMTKKYCRCKICKRILIK